MGKIDETWSTNNIICIISNILLSIQSINIIVFYIYSTYKLVTYQ